MAGPGRSRRACLTRAGAVRHSSLLSTACTIQTPGRRSAAGLHSKALAPSPTWRRTVSGSTSCLPNGSSSSRRFAPRLARGGARCSPRKMGRAPFMGVVDDRVMREKRDACHA
eukprot:scaffold3178_cov109-Isochrysis_galbana.AAC.11